MLEVRGVAVGNEATLVPGAQRACGSRKQPGEPHPSPPWVGPPLPVCAPSLSSRGRFETILRLRSVLLVTWLHLGTEGHNAGQGPALMGLLLPDVDAPLAAGSSRRPAWGCLATSSKGLGTMWGTWLFGGPGDEMGHTQLGGPLSHMEAERMQTQKSPVTLEEMVAERQTAC